MICTKEDIKKLSTTQVTILSFFLECLLKLQNLSNMSQFQDGDVHEEKVPGTRQYADVARQLDGALAETVT